MSLVLDASAWIELMLHDELGARVADRLRGQALHAPAHLDLEFLSALGRLHRAGELSASQVDQLIAQARGAPIQHHGLSALLGGAWSKRENLRIADALYVELADQLDVPLITTDQRLARSVSRAQVVQ